MGGGQAPFMYDHPSTYSFSGPTERGFNPKAASVASWTPRSEKSKPDGPLIPAKEFNRHPDSYFVVPYGNLNAKPMSPSTKKIVTRVRKVQLFLRILAFLGALGMLFCVICVKGTTSTLGWIIRVPPGVSILHTIYAIYHLIRSAKGRTAGSTASYMLFSAMIDAGLLPFYVFTAMMARGQYTTAPDTDGHWTTLFANDQTDYKIIFSTFLFSVTDGGLHLVSLIISIYLANIFRKISKLPPDMNPLESNLTSRNHKRNKSSMSLATTEASSNKGHSNISAPLISPPRSVPFMHTRNDSTGSLPPSPTRPSSASVNIRQSRAGSSSPTSSARYQPLSNRSSTHLDMDAIPQLSPTRGSKLYTTEPPVSTRPQSTHASLLNANSVLSGDDTENWESYPSPTGSPIQQKTQTSPNRNQSTTPNFSSPHRHRHSLSASNAADITPKSPPLSDTKPQYPPEFAHLRNLSSVPVSRAEQENPQDRHKLWVPPSPAMFNLAPLEMNPPTPPNQQAPRQQQHRQSYPNSRTLTPASGNASPAPAPILPGPGWADKRNSAVLNDASWRKNYTPSPLQQQQSNQSRQQQGQQQQSPFQLQPQKRNNPQRRERPVSEFIPGSRDYAREYGYGDLLDDSLLESRNSSPLSMGGKRQGQGQDYGYGGNGGHRQGGGQRVVSSGRDMVEVDLGRAGGLRNRDVSGGGRRIEEARAY
ncbi:hypothetical protein MMC25_005746 [Agyrium rufum]|nr:hypothetical protein [Agyrium rufum]